jgi:hypothetical protein
VERRVVVSLLYLYTGYLIQGLCYGSTGVVMLYRLLVA